jgi:hypothetical protein
MKNKLFFIPYVDPTFTIFYIFNSIQFNFITQILGANGNTII